ncbi:MAG: phosphate/phosphite/phosphonate ABC transporter substrate-binding protein [Phototrophicales bacterium]|nr:phosphate/phosphite/phosphonate ABC transporter substrate-binding protein [Phototrophicales bacterium]
MRVKFTFALLLVLLVSSLIIPATLAQESTIGTPENPIQVFFVPSVEAQTIVTGGEILAEALEAATGLSFEVAVPTSYAATVEAMCAAPDRSIGFIPAAGYVIASARCGVTVEAAAVRRGWNVYWAAYIVRRDSDIYTFGDLEGRTWAYPDASSTSGYIVPAVELNNAGITTGDSVEAGGHNQVVQAVYSGEVDFGTTFFSPPGVPGAAWAIGDNPEPYDLTVDESRIGEDGSLYVGDILILDARANIRETAPDVIDAVRILRLSNPIPNDTLSFGPDFPEELRAQIMEALYAFAQTEAWAESVGNEDFYSWSGIAPIEDSVYDVVRLQFEFLGLTEADIFGN